MREKQDWLIKRNEKEEVLPVEVTMESGETVLMTPLTFGELSEFDANALRNSTQAESVKRTFEILSKHLVDPKFEADEFKDVLPFKTAELMEKLLEVSGKKKTLTS